MTLDNTAHIQDEFGQTSTAKVVSPDAEALLEGTRQDRHADDMSATKTRAKGYSEKLEQLEDQVRDVHDQADQKDMTRMAERMEMMQQGLGMAGKALASTAIVPKAQMGMKSLTAVASGLMGIAQMVSAGSKKSEIAGIEDDQMAMKLDKIAKYMDDVKTDLKEANEHLEAGKDFSPGGSAPVVPSFDDEARNDASYAVSLSKGPTSMA